MTARKGSGFGDAIGQAATARRRPAAAATPTGPALAGSGRKYTVLLDDAAADGFDESLLAVRRQLGRKVDKSQVVRELLTLLGDDPAVLAKVVERLRLR